MGTRDKILITGGKGTVGKFLSTRLPYDILNPGRDELDLFDPQQVSNYLDQHSVDIVIHCALTGRNNLFSLDPVYTTDSLSMFRNLWNNKHKFKKLINLGTAYEFDLTKDNWLVNEYEIINHLPNTSYGYAKNIISRIIKDTNNFYNLRLFGVFHEEEADTRFFKKLFLNKSIEISNDIYMDYIYLGDIIPVINSIVEGKISMQDINMVYPEKYKMSQLAKLFCQTHNLDCSKIKIAGSNGLNLVGNPRRLGAYNLPLIKFNGFKLYKI